MSPSSVTSPVAAPGPGDPEPAPGAGDRPGPGRSRARAAAVALLLGLLAGLGPAAPATLAGQQSGTRAPDRAAPTVPVPPPTSARAVAEFTDSLARATLEEAPAAGLSVAVVRGGDTLVKRGWGHARREGDVPATAGTVYRIGSVTKQFTASAVLRQAAAGRLALSDTVGDLLPAFDAGGSAVTVRQLLNHTSGLVNYTDLEAFWRRADTDVSHRELLALVEDEPLAFEPGTAFAYSNTGYYLLGMIVERTTGRSYAGYVRDSLAAPLGLDRTRYCGDRPDGRSRAHGYRVAEDGGLGEAEPLDMSAPFAAGALCSTVGDLVAWTRALHAGEVVDGRWLEAMLTPPTLPDGQSTGYGFGVAVSELQGHRKVAHDGGINGFSSHLAHYPDDGLTVAVLVNTEGAPAGTVGERIARTALGLPQPDLVDLPLSRPEARRYTGKYLIEARGQPVQVTWEDGRLMAQAAGEAAVELLHQGRHEFRAGSDPTVKVEFLMDDGRAVGFLLHRSGETVRARRVERHRPEEGVSSPSRTP